MSLLDDVSLMITPNGVAEDVLFGVLPQPIIGTELVTNGDFATDSDWTIVNNTGTDSEITGGYLRIKTDGANTDVTQTNVTVAEKQYKLVYTVLSSDGGNLAVITIGNIASSIPSSVGTHTYYFTAHSTSFVLKRKSGALDVKLDNVSVREYTSADMDFTRATTATRINSSALITSVATGVPRIDYTGGGCPHILAEPQRTNLLDDGNAAASLTGVTVTNTTSPEGIANALKVTETTANSKHYATISEASVSSGSVYTMSIFVKKGTQSSVRIYTQSSRMVSDITFDLDAGSVTAVAGSDIVSGSGAISNYGNGWYRVSWSGTASGTGAMSIYATVKDLTIYTGSTSEYTEYFGGQVELGSYATSYIPTSGSTVTRNADVFTRTGIADLINSAEGVLYVEIAALDDDQTGRKISLNDGTRNNSVLIGYTSVSNEIKTKVNSGGSSTANMNFTATDILSYIKIAIKWKVNDFAMWVNGVEVVTDNSGAAPIGLTELSFDRGDGAENFRGKVRNLQVYKTALSDSQLTSLTT
tara:strand:- start:62 stop:1651 length:1590 start_codon:yes stop_codon:yes gene_type:complete